MNCRSCSSLTLALIPSTFAYQDFWVTGKHYRLLQCHQCGLVQTDIELWPEYFRDVYPTTYYAHTDKEKPGLRELVQAASLKETQEGKDSLPSWAAGFIGKFVLVNLPYVPNGKILDIGCGVGKLLNVASAAGFETYGIEPADSALRILQKSGHRAYRKLEELDVADDFFDIVVLNQSLEHMPHPFETVCLAASKLKSGGTLIVSVPNYSSAESQTFRQYWRHLDLPRHLTHFTFDTLLDMLEKANLVCVDQRYKFWGLPKSSLKMAVKQQGTTAYWLMVAFLLRQAWALITLHHQSYAAFMSLYCTKSPAQLTERR